MGSMSRRIMRNARRRLGELTDQTLDNLDLVADCAEELDQGDIVAWCDEAIASLEDTLARDGSPTDDTQRLLPELVLGIRDAFQRLRPAVERNAHDYAAAS